MKIAPTLQCCNVGKKEIYRRDARSGTEFGIRASYLKNLPESNQFRGGQPFGNS
jgi:hypothetical protein